MRAVTLTGFGDPAVMTWAEVPDPVAGPGEVVLEVSASAVNRADIMQRRGFYPPPPGAPDWLGLECSGRVASLGAGVTGWTVGQEAVALLAGGGYAQRVAVPAGQLLPVPAGVDLVTAAALPEVACTVWSNVVMLAALRAGEVLLIHGGASGIGTFAIQVGRELGATVCVTAGSPEKLARCEQLGAQVLVNYREEDFVAAVRVGCGGQGADVILDNLGASYLARNVELLAPAGRLVVIGLQGGRVGELDLGTLLTKRGSVHATSLRYAPLERKAEIVAAVRRELWPLIASGRIRPVVHASYPMTEAGQAHSLVEASEHVGKVLLTVPA
ncbi:MAG TPA: NAD(P)H-quinone oxidoreductase [Mycobacteriales bacterium]|nr:NAD(P)H-quinone oxidoreductase [Mycobacteriales bacterium]